MMGVCTQKAYLVSGLSGLSGSTQINHNFPNSPPRILAGYLAWPPGSQGPKKPELFSFASSSILPLPSDRPQCHGPGFVACLYSDLMLGFRL